jgi:outer membrane protein, multidrug efflux system
MKAQKPLSLITLIFLSGCVVGPDYEKPPEITGENTPEWSLNKDFYTSSSSIAGIDWQSFYKEPTLQTLIQKALDNNIDLKVASERVYRAKAGLKQSNASFLPQVDMTFEGEREKTSPALSTTSPKIDNEFQWSGNVSWEVDLWGKLRREHEANLAGLEATQADFYGSRISLIAQVANLYYQIQDAKNQIQLTNNNIVAREKSKLIAELRHQQGIISGLDVSQSNVELMQEQLKLPSLHNELNSAMYQLSILLDQSPRQLSIPDRPQGIQLKTELPVGLPSELLKRRPDIIAQERKLHAAMAKIGATKADYFPNISLVGSLGAKSVEVNDLLDNAEYWELNGEISMPIFNWGVTKANVLKAESEYRENVLIYRKAIYIAFKEAAEAIENVERNRTEYALNKKLLAATNEYLRIAILRYDNGVISYIGVLDAQRNQAKSQQDFSSSTESLETSIVSLYKTLGGGWSSGVVIQ